MKKGNKSLAFQNYATFEFQYRIFPMKSDFFSNGGIYSITKMQFFHVLRSNWFIRQFSLSQIIILLKCNEKIIFNFNFIN